MVEKLEKILAIKPDPERHSIASINLIDLAFKALDEEDGALEALRYHVTSNPANFTNKIWTPSKDCNSFQDLYHKISKSSQVVCRVLSTEHQEKDGKYNLGLQLQLRKVDKPTGKISNIYDAYFYDPKDERVYWAVKFLTEKQEA